MPDPNLFTARALRQVLQEAGIAITGTTRSTTDSMRYRQAPSDAAAGRGRRRARSATGSSRSSTRSQNWFAEMLLKQLGRQFGRRRLVDRRAGGRAAVPDRLGAGRLDRVRPEWTDPGLSSGNLVSPLAFTRILRFIRAHPRAPTFAAGLPQAGGAGSLRKRFVGTPLEGRVRAKDGSIGAGEHPVGLHRARRRHRC